MPKPTPIPGLSPRTPMSVAGPLLVQARLADVRAHEAALLDAGGEPDPDAVHDMRVATRRLRAALALVGHGALAELEREVKALQDALGAVRDLQVQRAWLEGAARDRDASARRELGQVLAGGLGDAAHHLQRALAAWRGAVAPTLIELTPALAAGRGRLGGRRVGQAVRRRLQRVERRLDRALADTSPYPVHRLRIAVKKLRYVAELGRAGHRRAGKALLRQLEPLQERLGDLHDLDVREERLAAAAGDGPDARRALAQELLREVRAERARQAEGVRAELARWRDAHLASVFRQAFGGSRARRRVDAAVSALRAT